MVVIAVLILLAYLPVITVPRSDIAKSNKTSTTISSQTSLFVEELGKLSAQRRLAASYLTNDTQYVARSGNAIVLVTTNQTITSYANGSNSSSVLNSYIEYSNLTTNAIIFKNLTTIYYYNTSTAAITCINETTYSLGENHSVFQCIRGAGLVFLNRFPFTLLNLSSMIPVTSTSRIQYAGRVTTRLGECDGFVVNTEAHTSSPINSTFTLCLDTIYGIPLYFNMSTVAHHVTQRSATLVAFNLSTNVSNSHFVIPQAWLKNASIV